MTGGFVIVLTWSPQSWGVHRWANFSEFQAPFLFFGAETLSPSCFPSFTWSNIPSSIGEPDGSRRAPRKKSSAVAREISSRESACSAKVAHVPWPRRIDAETPFLTHETGMWNTTYHKIIQNLDACEWSFMPNQNDSGYQTIGWSKHRWIRFQWVTDEEMMNAYKWFTSPVPKHSSQGIIDSKEFEEVSVTLCVHAHVAMLSSFHFLRYLQAFAACFPRSTRGLLWDLLFSE